MVQWDSRANPDHPAQPDRLARLVRQDLKDLKDLQDLVDLKAYKGTVVQPVRVDRPELKAIQDRAVR